MGIIDWKLIFFQLNLKRIKFLIFSLDLFKYFLIHNLTKFSLFLLQLQIHF
jgi:hypothetical protein